MSARCGVLALAAGLVAIAPAVAHAQGFGISASGGYFMANFKDSAKAVFAGSSGGASFGGEIRYVFGNGLYVAGGGSYFKKDGGRVFVADSASPVFPLRDEPLSVRLVPVYGTLGYRFGSHGSFVPYVGVGVGVTSYHEESTVGALTSTSSESKFGGHGLAGIEFGHGSLALAVELRYASVPNALGISGVSKVYDEKDIGGVTALGRIVFTMGGR